MPGAIASPVVTHVSPGAGVPGGGTSVTVTGSGFRKVTNVRFGTAAGGHLKVVSASKLTVVAPKHAAGVVDVRVVAAGGTSAITAADRFSYLSAPHVPFLESVAATGLGIQAAWAPAAAAAKVTGFSITVTPAAGSPKSCPARTVKAPASSTQAIAGGLCARVVYRVKVRARNAAALSPASPASAPVVPLAAQAPATPLVTSVLARDRSLAVRWAPPSDNGGRPVTGYKLTASGGGKTVTVRTAASVSGATVSGLTNGTAYKVFVSAVNAVGASRAAAGTGTPATAHAPAPPGGLSVVPDGKGHLVASWQAPADNGGSPVTQYTLTYQQATLDGGTGQWTPVSSATVQTLTVRAPALTATVSAFAQQAFYLFSITAASAAGTSAAAVQPAAVTPAVAVGTGVTVLGKATVGALTGATSSTLSWKDPAPAQARSLTAGRTIVAAPGGLLPRGMLRTVLSVTDKGGTLTVATARGKLSDVFSTLGVDADVNPAAGAVGSGLLRTAPSSRARFVPKMAGVRMIPAAGVGFGDSVTLSVDLKVGHVSVAAEASLTASVSLDLGVHTGFAGIPNGVSVSSSATVKADFGGTVQVEGDLWSREIGEIVGAPIDIQVGPVPVVVVPVVPVFLTLTGKGGLGLEVSGTIGGEISWSSGDKRPHVRNLSKSPKVNGQVIPAVTATGELDLHLEAQPQADIYDAAGPNVDGEFDDTAKVNFLPAAGEPFLSIGQQLQLKAGVDLNLLGVHASLEATIGSFAFGSFIIKDPPAAAYTITPANPVVAAGGKLTLKAVRSDGGTAKLTWRLIGATKSDSISSSGVLHVSAPAGRTLTVTAADASGAAGATAVSVGAPFDPPADVTATPAPGGSGVTVSWLAPSRTGGSGLTGYTILTQPSTGTHQAGAAARALALPSLTGGTYTIAVYATNKAGEVSDPGTTRIATGARSSSDWSVAKPGLPSGAASGQTPAPQIVCGGGSCVGAFGYSDNAGKGQVALYQLTAGGWSVTRAPDGQSAEAIGNGATPACAGDGFCAVLGQATVNGSASGYAVLWSLVSGKWTSMRAPVPASPGDLTLEYNNADLTCGQDVCAALGSAETKNGSPVTFFWTWTPSTGWTVKTAPLPKGVSGAGLAEGISLSCGSGVCAGASPFTDSANRYHLLAWTWTAKAGWSAALPALPSGDTLASNTPAYAGCGTGVCAMEENYLTSSQRALTALWTWTPAGGWKVLAAPPLPAAAAGAFVDAETPSCGNLACAALGDLGVGPNGASENVLWTWTPHSGWQEATLGVPSAAPGSANPEPYYVSCAAVGCAAIGTYTATTGQIPVSLWTWRPGSAAWTVDDIPPVPDASPYPGSGYYNFFTNIACGPVSCAASSSYFDPAAGTPQAVLWSWSPSAGWTDDPEPPLPADAPSEPFTEQAVCGLSSCVVPGGEYDSRTNTTTSVLWSSDTGA